MIAPTRPPMRGILADVVVIDLTQMLAGPYATMMLADQGATVIKIEPPNGDQTRGAGPTPANAPDGFSGYFQSINRNKLSLCIDLKTAEGREILARLVDTADVVVENFRVGVMERLGLSYETLSSRNPKLVYAAVRGFGDPRFGGSPYQTWPAYDVVAQGMGGIMSITGPDDATPMKIGPGIGDIVPAMFAAFGILAALHGARATGRGQFVDVAMYDSVLAICERMVHQYSYTGVVARPVGNRHPLLSPFGMFEAADGWVTIACPIDRFWCILCEQMGAPELGTDPRFATNIDRVAHNAETCALVSAWTRRLTRAELAERLGGRLPFGPVQDAADIFKDDHVRRRRMLAEVEQPGLDRKVKIANTAVRLSETPGGVWRRAPLLGEHSRQVLARVGCQPDAIDRLFAANIIKEPEGGRND